MFQRFQYLFISGSMYVFALNAKELCVALPVFVQLLHGGRASVSVVCSRFGFVAFRCASAVRRNFIRIADRHCIIQSTIVAFKPWEPNRTMEIECGSQIFGFHLNVKTVFRATRKC